MDLSKLKDRRVHFRNVGVKWLHLIVLFEVNFFVMGLKEVFVECLKVCHLNLYNNVYLSGVALSNNRNRICAGLLNYVEINMFKMFKK